MAEEEEKAEVEAKQVESVAERGSNPETGSTRGPVDLRGMALDAIHMGFQDIVTTIVKSIREDQKMPKVELLVGLAKAMNENVEVPAATYQSVAEVLWKSYQEQGKE